MKSKKWFCERCGMIPVYGVICPSCGVKKKCICSKKARVCNPYEHKICGRCGGRL